MSPSPSEAVATSIAHRLASGPVLRIAALAAIVLALLVAALVPPGPPEGDLVLGGIRLPNVCMTRSTLGIRCPGCGLTRSWVAALHGDFTASRAAHPLGLVVLAYFVLQALRQLAWLLAPRGRDTLRTPGRRLDLAGLALLGWLFLEWLITRRF